MPIPYLAEGLAVAKLAITASTKVQELIASPHLKPEAIRVELTALQDHVLSMQRTLSDAYTEIESLRRQVDDRESSKELEADMAFVQDGAFYVRKSEREQGILNAFCPVCWGEGRKLVSMLHLSNGAFRCITHRAMHETNASRETDRRRADDSMRAMNLGRGGPWS